jgi:hypothetical protein
MRSSLRPRPSRPQDGACGLACCLVPSARLELAQLSPLPPQDSVSTNFTTTALSCLGGMRNHSVLASQTVCDSTPEKPCYRASRRILLMISCLPRARFALMSARPTHPCQARERITPRSPAMVRRSPGGSPSPPPSPITSQESALHPKRPLPVRDSGLLQALHCLEWLQRNPLQAQAPRAR